MSGRRAVAVAVAVLAAGVIAYVLATKTSEHGTAAPNRTATEPVVPPTLAPAPPAPVDAPPPPPAEAEEPDRSGPDASTDDKEGFRVPVRLRYASGAPLVGEIEIGL